MSETTELMTTLRTRKNHLMVIIMDLFKMTCKYFIVDLK